MKNILLFFLFPIFGFAQSTLISTGNSWKYLDNGSNQNTAWRNVGFDDSGWASGASELGYGDGDEATTVGFGGNAVNKYVTTYFRKTFTLTSTFSFYKIRVKRDDGLVVYFNGTEIVRDNLPENFNHQTLASPANDDGAVWLETIISGNNFVVGSNNVIAVEIHQNSASSSDISFDLELIGNSNQSFGTTLVASNAVWKYLDNGSNQGTAWRGTGFVENTWASGSAELGYGEGDETTVVNYGGNAANKYITTYFRKNITLASTFNSYILNVKRDDGVVVYFNGTEVYRNNLASNPAFNDLATEASDDGKTWFSTTLASNVLQVGSNTIAVEIHQSAVSSSDISFNLELFGSNLSVNVTRGAYLQMGTTTSMQIRWRTDVATSSKISFGNSPINLNSTVSETSPKTEHIINLAGLSPNTKYYYSVGNSTDVLQTSNQHFFYTAPTIGTEKKTRIWATGDCGTGTTTQINVKNAFLNQIDNNYIDLWLLLGDNAYSTGTDAEYQTNFFQPYQNDRIMKQTALFPAPGNHDYYSSSQNSRTGAYYQNFTLPTNAEVGGLASGTEAYYSYNFANIHFVSLDSYGTETANNYQMKDTLSPQIVWLKADLAANTQKWTILYWHHPPYTMGSHNSDTETDLKAIRENLIPILERHKVDLILCGHSHNYERTRLIKGHYGLEPTFNASVHNKSSSSGKYDGSVDSCPYIKNTALPNKGIVYVVAGSAGWATSTQGAYPHDAMYYSNTLTGGSLYLEIEANRLDAKWISETGNVMDNFTIMKDVSKKTDVIVGSNQANVSLSASWSGNYNWQIPASTARSITVTPVVGNMYFVEDDRQCLKDTFLIKVNPACQNSHQISVEMAGNADYKFEASQTITANNMIQNGTNIKYDARNSVLLTAGFQVKAGAKFSAYIDGCGGARIKSKDD